MKGSDGSSPGDKTKKPTPPVEHRFKKGTSGNPKGRPRRVRQFTTTQLDGKPGVGFEDPFQQLTLEEAYRLITVREGDKTEKIPAIQAILRSLAVNAAKGNARAQEMFLTFVSSAEGGRREANLEILRSATEYKERWGSILKARRDQGSIEPDPVPHPADIVIDPVSGEVRIDGPVLADEKARMDYLIDQLPMIQQQLQKVEQDITLAPEDRTLKAKKKRLIVVIDKGLYELGKRERRKRGDPL